MIRTVVAVVKKDKEDDDVASGDAASVDEEIVLKNMKVSK